MNDERRRALFLGELESELERLVRGFRTIGCDQDLLHGVLLCVPVIGLVREPGLLGEKRRPRAERRGVEPVVQEVGQPLRDILSLEDEDDDVGPDVHAVLVESGSTRVEGRTGSDELSGTRLRSFPQLRCDCDSFHEAIVREEPALGIR